VGQGKPTPGQIGAIDGDKLFAYLIAQAKTGMDERDQDRMDTLRDVAHVLGRFSVGQGQDETPYKNSPLEKIQDMRTVLEDVMNKLDSGGLRKMTDMPLSEQLIYAPVYAVVLKHFGIFRVSAGQMNASADKAQGGKGEGK